MKPYMICHMITSLDGALHTDHFTTSPDGDWPVWFTTYGTVNEALACDGWLVGRVTMAEMHQADPHPPETFDPVDREQHIAPSVKGGYMIVLDPSGKLHFGTERQGWQNMIVLLGAGAADSHLAELVADGISYLVFPDEKPDPERALLRLNEAFGLKRLALLGGGSVNGAFLEAGLVDEMSVLVAPALDGRPESQGFVTAAPDGLKGKVQLSFQSAEAMPNGLVHLRYKVAKT